MNKSALFLVRLSMAKCKFFAMLILWLVFFFFVLFSHAFAQQKGNPIKVGKDGQLVYQTDEKGNKITDFSYCGYSAGQDSIPNVPVKIIVPVVSGDATKEIQHAINYVSSLPKKGNGFRGTVLLKKGVYKVYGRLKITTSGVVLRGRGMGKDGTVLKAMGKNRKTLIRVYGKDDIDLDKKTAITDAYVPVGSKKLKVSDGHYFQKGDDVVVRRNCTEEWIDTLGVSNFGGESGWIGWKPNEELIQWNRKIVAVHGNELTLNIGLTTAIDSSFGGGSVASYHWPGIISNVGIENIHLVSDYDTSNPKDEAHCWMAIT